MAEPVKTSEQALDTARDTLIAAFADRYHSLARYILDSCPFIRDEDAPLLARIEAIAAYDEAEAEFLADLIERMEGVPTVPPYAHEVAELNYMSLPYLRDVLYETMLKQLARYEAGLANVAAYPDARNAMNALCEIVRQHSAPLAPQPSA